MRSQITTESPNPESEGLDRLSALEIVQIINREDEKVASAIAERASEIAEAIERIRTSLCDGGRLIYVGAGTSGRLGVLDASECPPTFNADPKDVVGIIAGGDHALRNAVEGAEDSAASGEFDLLQIALNKADVVTGIAASGGTPYVRGALEYARRIGAGTIALSCNADSAIGQIADIDIAVVVGPEVLAGSTRMKAGTATKMVLNMLTTGAMVLLGKTYGNLMVDLRASNAKLKDRAIRIVGSIAGLSDQQAREVLERCAGEVKTAVVCHKHSLEPDEARARLARSDGQLRQALGETQC